MKVINDLLDYSNLKIVQDDEWFNFSLDSVLLPNFVKINKIVKNILDLGTGNAPIPMILSTMTNAKIYGIELQKEIYDLAVESLKINKLENRIGLINDNIKNLDKYFEPNSFDVIVSNPPYFKYNENSNINESIQKTIARHEKEITLSEIVFTAKKFLNNNGTFAMVHRTDRLIEIIEEFKKNNIEPKRIRLIYPKVGEESNMVLIEGRKNGNVGLKILPPLIAHTKDGEYPDEGLPVTNSLYDLTVLSTASEPEILNPAAPEIVSEPERAAMGSTPERFTSKGSGFFPDAISSFEAFTASFLSLSSVRIFSGIISAFFITSCTDADTNEKKEF